MATPADQRLLELLGKWLESLELHAKYSSLDEDSYWRIQPWAEHQRPTRWIVDLAKQKTLALRAQVEERIKAGDAQFSDSLELMTFLANLVGSEHIERFIPVADAKNERLPPPREEPPAAPNAATGTREMPQFLAAGRSAPTAAPASTTQVARNERKPKPALKPAAKKALLAADKNAPADAAREQVIADAARLVQWGRKWYELPELIARMADRPALPEVRRILKENKAAIDKKAGVG
jgi:hypothetical protein